MKSGPVEGEGGGKGGGETEGGGRAVFEGMEALATAIETGTDVENKWGELSESFICYAVLSQVQIDLTDTVVQLVCRSQDYLHQYFVRVRVEK